MSVASFSRRLGAMAALVWFAWASLACAWADEPGIRLLRSEWSLSAPPAAPSLVAPRVAAAPTIDGRLDDAAWSNAPVATNFLVLGSTKTASPQTRARLVFDQQALHVAFECVEPALPQLQARTDLTHDTDPVWQDDCVEVCLSAPGDQAVWHLILSAGGGRYDEKVTGKTHDSGWNGDWSAAVGRGQGVWQAELRVPWSALGAGVPVDGARWRLQLARGRRPHPEQTSVWSCNVHGGVVRAESMGTLILGAPVGPASTNADSDAANATLEPPLLRFDGSTLTVAARIAPAQARSWQATLRVADSQGSVLAELTHPLEGSELSYAIPAERWRGRPITLTFEAGPPGAAPPRLRGQAESSGKMPAFVTTPRRDVLPQRQAPAGHQLVPVRVVTPPLAVTQATMPVRCGVPVPRGALRDPSLVTVSDSRGRPALAQARALAWWEAPGDPQRSVKWLLVSFDASTEAKAQAYEVHLGADVAPATIASPLRVEQTDQGVSVDTGAMRLAIDRSSPRLITQAWRGGRALLGDSARAGLYVVDHEGTLYRSALDRDATLVIESQGPHEAVIKAQGRYISGDGRPYNQWTTRLHAYANRPFVRVVHSFVLTEGSEKRRVREIGLELPLRREGEQTVRIPRGTPYAVAADLPEPIQSDPHTFTGAALDEQGQLTAFQDSQRTWKLLGRGESALLSGERSGHWLSVVGPRGGLTVAARWWWQQYPNAMTWRRESGEVDTLSLAFWTRRGAGELDLRPEPFVRSKGVWDYWSKQIMQVKDRRHEFPPSLGGTLTSDGGGVSKTHELTLWFHDVDDAGVAAQAGYLTQKPVYAHVDPAWLDRSEAMGRLHPRDEVNFPQVEAAIDTHLQVERLRQSDDRYGNPEYHDSYGLLDFGDTLHSGKYAHRYWSHFFYCEPTVWWTLYARSGDRGALDFAQANARHHMDIDTCHWDVGPRQTPGSINHDDAGFFHWDYNDGYISTSNYLTYLTACHYLTGDERARDVAVMIGEMIKRRIASGYQAGWSHRGTGMTLWNLVELCNLTWDPVIREHADLLADQVKRNVRDGLSTGYSGAMPLDFTLAYIFPAAIAYHQATGDPAMAQWIVDQAVGIARRGDGAFQGKYFTQWDGLAYAWRLTGDDALLALPRHFLTQITQSCTPRDVDVFVGNRVWWMQKAGYLMHALAHAGSVPAQAPPWSTAGEIRVLDERDEPFCLMVRMQALGGDDPRLLKQLGKLDAESSRGGPALVLIGPDGAEVDRRVYPASPRVDPWFSYGGWLETFDLKSDGRRGVYRLRMESSTGVLFQLHLVHNTLGKAMFSGGVGDGVSPNGRFAPAATHVLYVPADVARWSVALLPPPHLHDAKLVVRDGQGAAVVDRNIGRETGRQRDQWITVDIDVPENQRGRFWTLELSGDGELRLWKLKGVEPFVARSVAEAFEPGGR
jgi:hypothetical protein